MPTSRRADRPTVVLAKAHLAGIVNGTNAVFVSYALHLHRAGHLRTVVVLYQAPTDGDNIERLQRAGIEVIVIGRRGRLERGASRAQRAATGWGLGNLLPWLRRLRIFVSQQTADVYLDDCVERLKASDARVVHVIHGDEGAVTLIKAARRAHLPVLFHTLSAPDGSPDVAASREHFSRVLHECAGLAALSPSLADGWTRAFSSARFGILPLMIDVSRKRPALPQSGPVTFGFAGRLESAKGPLTLIEAFARARATGIPMRLRIAGGGSQESAARQLAAAASLGVDCELLGALPFDRIPDFLATLNVFVLPSLTEGTPNSVAEAMAMGLPTIASDVGGIPDMLSEGAGFLISPGDVSALTSAMIDLAADPERRLQMGRQARRRFELLFTPEAVVPLAMATYDALLQNKSTSLSVSEHPWSHL